MMDRSFAPDSDRFAAVTEACVRLAERAEAAEAQVERLRPVAEAARGVVGDWERGQDVARRVEALRDALAGLDR